MITIDASVLVAAGDPGDPRRAEASAAMETAIARGMAIHQPTLTLIEIGAAIARRSDDVTLAREAGAALLSLPGLVLHPLVLAAATDAAAVAAELRLRGADAIYVATALQASTTLITLDDEQSSRARSIVPTATPATWLAQLGQLDRAT